MDEADRKPEIKVTDRRRFSAEGEPIDGEEEPASAASATVTDAEPPPAAVPLPPPTFEFLVHSLRFQAELAMGLYGGGGDDNAPEADLEAARHSIDLLGVLQEKTRGNLAWVEQRLLENSLTELRFRFVQVADKARAKS